MEKQENFIKTLIKNTKKNKTQTITITSIIVSTIILSLYLILNYKPQLPELSKTNKKTSSVSSTKKQKSIIQTSFHKAYPETINGKVITLKKLNAKFMFDYFLMFSDPVRKDLEFPQKVTFGYVSFYVKREIEKMTQDKLISYCIFDNKVNKLVGAIEIREKNNIDPGQLGMWLNENYRGGGRIQEALFLISKAYFQIRKEADSYIVHVRPYNYASYNAMKQFGFTKVGDYIEKDKVTRYILKLSRKDIEQKIKNFVSP